MIYVASPYSDKNWDTMVRRAEDAAEYAAHCMNKREKVYCPIAAWHWVAMTHDLPKDWPAWRALDYDILRHCSEIRVLCLDGWRASKGVTAERRLAKLIGIPEVRIDPNTFEEFI